MPDLRTVLTETQRAEIRDAISAHRLWNGRCEACGAVSRRESDHMADVVIETLAGLPGVAVTQLPEQPSEYWGPQHQPQWNNYPFTRVGGDEIEIGARSEYVYRVNVAEARTHAADLLAAVRVIEPAEVTS